MTAALHRCIECAELVYISNDKARYCDKCEGYLCTYCAMSYRLGSHDNHEDRQHKESKDNDQP